MHGIENQNEKKKMSFSFNTKLLFNSVVSFVYWKYNIYETEQVIRIPTRRRNTSWLYLQPQPCNKLNHGLKGTNVAGCQSRTGTLDRPDFKSITLITQPGCRVINNLSLIIILQLSYIYRKLLMIHQVKLLNFLHAFVNVCLYTLVIHA